MKKIYTVYYIYAYIPQTQKWLLMNAYFMSQFGYCSVVWMNHSRTLNNQISRLHERALSLAYNNSSSFSELLEKDKYVTVCHHNLQTLAYEIFKLKKKHGAWNINRNISPEEKQL